MKILFLGSVTNEIEIETLSGKSIAGNKMQLNLLRGLNKYEDVEISVISTLSIASFPIDKIYQKYTESQLGENIYAKQVPFINIPILKQVSQTISIFIFTFIHLLSHKNSIIFSFNIYPQQGISLYLNSLIFKCKTITLLADLPIDDVVNRNLVWKFLRSIFDSLTIKFISKIDNLIVLNKNVIDYYNYKNRYIVMDGAINIDDFTENEIIKSKNKKNVVYSGALVEYNGIRELIESFIRLESGITLDIYGSGYLQDEVRTLADKSENIFYHGNVSNEEMRKIQRNAWLLVNPRNSSDLITRLTFPSKLLEYMASGTAVVSTIVPGMDSIYYELLYILESNKPNEISQMIRELSNLNDQELCKKGKEAKDFVLKNKTWDVVNEEIYEFMVKI